MASVAFLPATATSTAAPTTTTTGTVARLTEGTWLKAVTNVHQKIDERSPPSEINMTRAKMIELEDTLPL